ncbi:hypothetical protein ACWER6_12385 [Streptomyces sp. NPDC004009]
MTGTEPAAAVIVDSTRKLPGAGASTSVRTRSWAPSSSARNFEPEDVRRGIAA